jgi:hypothetical protein
VQTMPEALRCGCVLSGRERAENERLTVIEDWVKGLTVDRAQQKIASEGRRERTTSDNTL